ncbi:MAG: MG2 domain-containing protein [Cytophagales bacterium]
MFTILKQLSGTKKILLGVATVAVGALSYVGYQKFFKKDYVYGSSSSINPAFASYISAYTSGMVSKKSTIKVMLTQDAKDSVALNTPLDNNLFDFSPNVDGKIIWKDKRTVEFVPEKEMDGGQIYETEFALDKVANVSSSELEEFEFKFRVIPQSFLVNYNGLKIIDNNTGNSYSYNAEITTADVVENTEIENMLSAKLDGSSPKIKWTHKDGRIHSFTIEPLNRENTAKTLVISFDADAIKADGDVDKEVQIPALGDYHFIEHKVVQGSEQHIQLIFSDPLDKNQDLLGLIKLGDLPEVKTVVDGNHLKIYPIIPQNTNMSLWVSPSLRNFKDKKLTKDINLAIEFEELKPALKDLTKGVILPNTQGIVFPFEAVGLRTVKVTVTKIFQNNIPQFLQINTLSESDQLYRVGKVIRKKVINLGHYGAQDLSKWNTYHLDLSELVQMEPGAIYQVNMSFGKENLLTLCEGTEATSAETMAELEPDPAEEYNEERSYWDSSEDYYYDNEYDYSQRDNPCNSAYYNSDKFIVKNILASDLGIVAKKGTNGSMLFAVSDLKTTKPMSDVELEILDFQQQVMATTKTNGEGIAEIQVKGLPFLLIAKAGNQRGYLKLDNTSVLNYSHFDVTGSATQRGVKGFIYGERGVWRPGDTLYLGFMLEDKFKSLPKNHPIVFELLNPLSQLKDRQVSVTNEYGVHTFTTHTSESDVTGNWTARVKVGGAVFTENIKIEAIKPNKLKMNLDFGKKKLGPQDQSLTGNLDVKWLHGAVANGLKVEYQAVLSQGITSFSKYPEYIFDDPGISFNTETKDIFDGTLDANGTAKVNCNINPEAKGTGAFNVTFKGKVYENGGGFSVDRFTLPYYAYPVYLGMQTPKGDKARGMLLTDEDHSIKLAAVNSDGQPTISGKIKVEVYKLEWKWWWENSTDDVPAYVSESYQRPISSFEINPIRGQGNFNFRINQPEWGRYYIRATDLTYGHSTGKVVYVDWPGWAGRQQNNPGAANMLSFSAKQESYKVGDKVEVNFPSSSGGRALVTIENGTKVLKAMWVETEKNNTSFSFEAESSMSPNCYVSITLIQPHQRDNDLPIRLYGTIPLLIEDPKTHLYPVLAMANSLTPKQKFNVQVSEKEGNAMAYTLAIVDEGLLDLTKFKTPDPWGTFYAKEALGVKTWDMYDLVMGAFSGKIDRLVSIGGDGAVKAKDGRDPNRFKPVVKFIGPFFLASGKNNNHTIEMPNYIGSVRVMLIAGNNGAYGLAEKTVPVKQPMMVSMTLPRVLRPGEEFHIPANVFAMENNIRQVNLSVKVNGLIQPLAGTTRTVSFTKAGDKVVYFPVRVGKNTGTAKIELIAQSGSIHSSETIELLVSNPNPPAYQVQELTLNSGASNVLSFKAIGLAGTNKTKLEISTIPALNLEKRLGYLMQYPHGCIEQTTSSVFPQLTLNSVMELSEKQKLQAETNIKAGIERIQSFQTSNGGFAYWPGNTDADEWGTNYAGHFLIEAQNLGYNVPSSLLTAWATYQQNKANNWMLGSGEKDLNQAYRLYTLALAKSPALGAMNRMKDLEGLSNLAKWRLAAAYALAGQKQVANSLITNLSIETNDSQKYYYETYGSATRDEAMIMETLVLLGEDVQAAKMLNMVAQDLGSNQWMSTQTTAYSLLAVAKYCGNNGNNKGLNFSYNVNGSGNKAAKSGKYFVSLDMPTQGNVNIANTGNGILFVRLISQGTPDIGNETPTSNDLNISVQYKDRKGQMINISNVNIGTEITAEVSITNPGLRGDYQNLALSQIFPSGWEINNSRMDGTAKADNPAEYKDIKDDRVYTYFDLKARQTKKFTVSLTAAYPGKYYLPAQNCENMYDKSISAQNAGQWVYVLTENVRQ